MLLIAIDTSGRNGSVALCRGNRDSFETVQLIPIEGGTYSARLMPAIAELLANQQLSKEQIDAFVVVSGPGSFTGLRVGIATVKGLCEALQKPLVAVSMLEAVAVLRGPDALSMAALKGYPSASLRAGFFSGVDSELSHTALATEGQPSKLAVGLDAGRGEMYVGDFLIDNSRVSMLRESIIKLEAFSREATSSSFQVLTPDAKVAETLSNSGARVQLVQPLDAEAIARIGLTKFLAGELADPATLDANYIRRSDAEIFAPPQR